MDGQNSFKGWKEDVWLIEPMGWPGRVNPRRIWDRSPVVLELDDGYLLMGTTQSYGSAALISG